MIVEVNDTQFTIEKQLQLTKQAYSASSLNERTLTSTNQISILKTNESDLLFLKGDFATPYKCKIIDNTIISEGIGFLTKIDSDYYYLTVVDKTKELFNRFTSGFKDSTILDQYDYLHNADSFTALHDLNNGSIWVWAYSNMHEQATSSNNPEGGNLDYSRPFIYVKKVIDLIEDSAGWQQNDTENDLLISANHEHFYLSTYEKILADTYNPVGSVQMGGFDTYDFKHSNVTPATSSIVVSNINQTKFSIRLRGDYTADSDMYMKIIATSSSETIEAIIELPANQNTIDARSLDFYSDTQSFFTLTFSIYGTGQITFENTRLYTFYDEIDIIAGTIKSIYDFRIKTYDNLQINTYELFKSFININGFFINSESFTKKIELNKFSEISRNNSLDWSDKFQELLNISGEYLSLLKNNYFSYDNEEDLGSLGSAYFTINSDIEGSTSLVHIPYSASQDVNINSKIQASIPIYGIDKDSGLESRITLKKRVLEYQNDGTATFSTLSFNSLIDNYSTLIDGLKDQKVYEISALITQSDFLAYKFIRPIYIRQLQGTFLIISMTFISNENLSQIKLLKI